jgi:hypothetical protein
MARPEENPDFALAHGQISTTLDLYSNVTPTMQREATEAIDLILAG